MPMTAENKHYSVRKLTQEESRLRRFLPKEITSADVTRAQRLVTLASAEELAQAAEVAQQIVDGSIPDPSFITEGSRRINRSLVFALLLLMLLAIPGCGVPAQTEATSTPTAEIQNNPSPTPDLIGETEPTQEGEVLPTHSAETGKQIFGSAEAIEQFATERGLSVVAEENYELKPEHTSEGTLVVNGNGVQEVAVLHDQEGRRFLLFTVVPENSVDNGDGSFTVKISETVSMRFVPLVSVSFGDKTQTEGNVLPSDAIVALVARTDPDSASQSSYEFVAVNTEGRKYLIKNTVTFDHETQTSEYKDGMLLVYDKENHEQPIKSVEVTPVPLGTGGPEGGAPGIEVSSVEQLVGMSEEDFAHYIEATVNTEEIVQHLGLESYGIKTISYHSRDLRKVELNSKGEKVESNDTTPHYAYFADEKGNIVVAIRLIGLAQSEVIKHSLYVIRAENSSVELTLLSENYPDFGYYGVKPGIEHHVASEALGKTLEGIAALAQLAQAGLNGNILNLDSIRAYQDPNDPLPVGDLDIVSQEFTDDLRTKIAEAAIRAFREKLSADPSSISPIDVTGKAFGPNWNPTTQKLILEFVYNPNVSTYQFAAGGLMLERAPGSGLASRSFENDATHLTVGLWTLLSPEQAVDENGKPLVLSSTNVDKIAERSLPEAPTFGLLGPIFANFVDPRMAATDAGEVKSHPEFVSPVFRYLCDRQAIQANYEAIYKAMGAPLPTGKPSWSSHSGDKKFYREADIAQSCLVGSQVNLTR